MAISQQRQDHGSASFPWDALYCAEEQWDEGGRVGAEGERLNGTGSLRNRRGSSSFDEIKPCLLPLLLLEQDSFRVDEELLFLFSKERQQQIECLDNVEGDASLCLARREAVEWMLKVNAYYGFSTLTAILALNYLDKFLSSLCFRKDKPWIIQLAAVTCLSLAAKVEEPQVPRLVDLQVEGTNTLFEAKTIQKWSSLCCQHSNGR
ncbi:hypothetical protein Nepgr_018137 [Nepenthes gracilis]|uniref:Cyclin-like domain-containing protein n=1 Tax=Nepenthes gracilis TaxID=150966 RepID=A0AAD3SU68_NEPGR|nr:hypothetical protein Nepgr_018137 [Nepenthes gracilis]